MRLDIDRGYGQLLREFSVSLFFIMILGAFVGCTKLSVIQVQPCYDDHSGCSECMVPICE